MNLKCAANRRLYLISVCTTILLAAALMLFVSSAAAQASADDATTVAQAKTEQQNYQTFYLTNATDRESLNDIQTDMRNMIPRAKIYGVSSKSAITVLGTADEIAMAKKLIGDLDKPRKVYRLTYTITDSDGGQAKSARHYTLVVASGEKTVFKQGDRVPIITGRASENPTQTSTQVQYVDVGINVDASLTTSADVLALQTKLELSSVANPLAGADAGDPDIRQTVLQETASLTPDKPLALGSIDVPGTSRHEEVEVEAELIR